MVDRKIAAEVINSQGECFAFSSLREYDCAAAGKGCQGDERKNNRPRRHGRIRECLRCVLFGRGMRGSVYLTYGTRYHKNKMKTKTDFIEVVSDPELRKKEKQITEIVRA